jgi:hypothetical protein
MYHPAAALRTPSIERESYEDVARIPGVLTAARERRRERRTSPREAVPVPTAVVAAPVAVDTDPDSTDQLTFF